MQNGIFITQINSKNHMVLNVHKNWNYWIKTNECLNETKRKKGSERSSI